MAMATRRIGRLAGLLLLPVTVAAAATAADGRDDPRAYVLVNPEAGVPVFDGDITDRPYVVLGEVHAGVRKATVFSGPASKRKIYRELWERARKMGADAVIKAEYGKSHISAISWGKTNATGIAIKFTGPPTAYRPAP